MSTAGDHREDGSGPGASGPPLTAWVLIGEATRTGVPIVLERLLRWSRRHHTLQAHVVAVAGGGLVPLLGQQAASVTVLEPDERRTVLGAAAAGLADLGRADLGQVMLAHGRRHRLRRLPRPDVLLMHGAGGWPLLAAVPHPGVPLVVHLHELALGLDRSIPAAARGPLFGSAHRVLGVSRPVLDLALAAGAPAARTELLGGVVDPEGPWPADHRDHPFGPGARWVGGAGQPGWRKGADRFSALAHELGRRPEPVGTLWVGGPPAGANALAVGAADPVRWQRARPDPWAVLADASVIVVPSREDPLPLVALEAGQHRRPVVAADTGGLSDLLGDGAGTVVPGFDLRALTDAVSGYLAEPARADEAGAALAARVAAEHTVDVVGPAWVDALAAAAAAG